MNRKVLIPSDDPFFLPGMKLAYEELGFDVVSGPENLWNTDAKYDIIHLMWPETYCFHSPPNAGLLKRLRATLGIWRRKAHLVQSVNNFYPHGYIGNTAYWELYNIFYESCHLVHHFSNSSLEQVSGEWPVVENRRQIVTHAVNYRHLVHADSCRKKLRSDFGLDNDAFVLLCFGAIRNWSEARLLIRALSQTSIQGFRVLNAARYRRVPGSITSMAQKLSWRFWARFSTKFFFDQVIPDEDVYRFFGAADAVVVPRIDSLSSGIPMMAMTFGRCTVAPDSQTFREYLPEEANEFYTPGDPESLSAAIQRLALRPRASAEAKNFEQGSSYSWKSVITKCLHEISSR
ncbi:hypothetical protein V7x_25680 [Crateriforma conspicua]|uniref:Glycosyl transferases group 1 n=1 Tax=Crateriforma conspicua TaxID=2527996 RepID=A0A5C6FX83_9PLAN|nr:glycosyltransferase [Crateriforma conspicua]TWU66996.1 hypothetical protein V7x_25680 [Crateriforma conspicua]